MTDIYFQNLQDFYAEYGLDKILPNHVPHFFIKKYPELFEEITKFTQFLGKTYFTEKLYCYVDSIKDLPKCKVCSNHVHFLRSRPHGYNRYCSQRCSMLDMKTLIGVENSSQLE